MLYCFFHNFTIRAIEGGKDPTRAPYREQEIGKRFVQIVHSHFQVPALNVESIADMMGIRPSTLTRKIKKELCRTPHNYLISYSAQQGLGTRTAGKIKKTEF